MRKFLAVFLSVNLLFAGLNPAHAQSSARLSLYALQTASFPSMTAGLDVFDSAGNFVTGLTARTVTLLEDNQPRPLNSLEELQPGTEFALALDPGPYFAYRDVNAVTRFDKVMKALKEWAAAHPDSLGDDLSLIPTGGTPATHLATTAAFSDALAAYQPDLNTSSPAPKPCQSPWMRSPNPASQTGRKPVVLYITSFPAAGDIPVLQNLTQRAVAGYIRVDVWIVASQDFFSTSGATALKDLAIQTGGQSFLFSGDEPLPSPETYLAPLRHTYQLEYSSGILTSGGHTLAAQVSLNGEPVTSAALPFELDVQPPNPILVAPPVQIVRTAPDERTTAVSSFLPTQQIISIIIEFPDRRTRPLVRTVLYVDGVLAAENTSDTIRPIHLGFERLHDQRPAYPHRGSRGQLRLEQGQPGGAGAGHHCPAAGGFAALAFPKQPVGGAGSHPFRRRGAGCDPHPRPGKKRRTAPSQPRSPPGPVDPTRPAREEEDAVSTCRGPSGQNL